LSTNSLVYRFRLGQFGRAGWAPQGLRSHWHVIARQVSENGDKARLSPFFSVTSFSIFLVLSFRQGQTPIRGQHPSFFVN
jgi:hypothetical protein